MQITTKPTTISSPPAAQFQQTEEFVPSEEPKIGVVIPSYKVRDHILSLIERIGSEVSRIYVVDDACPQRSGDFVRDNCFDPRVVVLCNRVNEGVGGAVMLGYRQAVLDDMTIVVKLDGDGQMDPSQIKALTRPLAEGRADYTKGNRFFKLEFAESMPSMRVFGNAVLSFMSKLSTGYWHIFDPTNGYTAVHAKIISELPLSKISKRYFFETDMLFRLNTLRCVVQDVPMPAIYGSERSNLRIREVIPEFLRKHAQNLVKRLFYNYLLRNFSVFSIELFLGLCMLTGGTIFGGIMWYHFASKNIPATSGIVMLAALPIILGMQFLLSFLHWDAQSIPTDPLHKRL